MWGFNKKNQNERPGSIDFDSAAARVTAADPLIAEAAATTAIEEDADEALIIKQEWAIVAVKGAFYPAARWIHPAYAVNDAEAAKVGPKMQLFLQAVADKYAPAVVGRLASRYPEFWDLLGAVGILYYEKWRAVSQLIAEEAAARQAEKENNRDVIEMPPPAPAAETAEEPERKVVGERMRDGTLVI